QEFDLVIKALAERYPAHFVQLVRGIPVDNVERLEKEAVALKRESDMAFKISENGYEYIMILEAQTRIDRDMPRRLLEYTAMQHREYKKPVYPVVLNLTDRLQEDGYGFDCLDLTVVAFNYRLINLADLPGEEVLKHGPVGIIPLVPLMRHQLPDEEVLAECARRIEEAPVQWQPDLYLGLALFSSLRFTREIILKIIEVSKMEASPLFDGIREKWIDQGLREDRIEAILEALEENTGRYPGHLAEKLRSIQDMGTLKSLFRRAVKVKSLEEFMSALDGEKGQAN
ncbi:MAG TPA: Rpn family recombination-promoting nuclease/putative transposase, partial [Desulfotomaculum sp.]|nr:Rpn family recombination-promoting nuclease/putative transposase [Desulfotomaculum sp.]